MIDGFEKYLLKYEETKERADSQKKFFSELMEKFYEERNSLDNIVLPPWHEFHIKRELHKGYANALEAIRNIHLSWDLIVASIDRLHSGDFFWEERSDHLKAIQPVFDSLVNSMGKVDVCCRLDKTFDASEFYKKFYWKINHCLETLKLICCETTIDRDKPLQELNCLVKSLKKLKSEAKKKIKNNTEKEGYLSSLLFCMEEVLKYVEKHVSEYEEKISSMVCFIKKAKEEDEDEEGM